MNTNELNEKSAKIISITSPEQVTLIPLPPPSTLRSILRKHVEIKVSTNTTSNVQQTSILINENDEENNNNDDDEEEEEESNASDISIDKKGKINDQHYHHSSPRRQVKEDRFFPSSSPPSDAKTSSSSSSGTSSIIWTRNHDHSSNRTTYVTFTNDQPTIYHRNSSTPSAEGSTIETRPSIAYVNMKEDLPRATAASTDMTSDYRPVYVSPLKYRPLLGLSANDSRLLLEKRVSLLGKPLVFHQTQKRSQTYRRAQLRIYNFLERANGYQALIYHAFVFITVFVCLFLSVVVTMPEYEKLAERVLLPSEIVVFIWLSIEFTLRVWSAGCRSRYQTLTGRLRFMKKPFCALDFIVILATFVTLCMNLPNGNGVFAASALRGLRFFQILRMLRMDRRGGTWKLLGSVVYAHRQELITTIYIGFLVLIFSSFVMFLVEKDTITESKSNVTNSFTNLIDTDRHKFETFADALWWGIITLCTVGYGDKVPSSYIGKLVAAICSFIGISFFALPAGILGSGFALKVQQQQRQKHYKRRKIPAVLLIQNLWRVYAADEKSLSKATWKVHVRPPRKNNDTSPASQTNHHHHHYPISFKMRNNQSFLDRVSFRRRPPTPVSPGTIANEMNTNSSIKSLPASTVAAMRTCMNTVSDSPSLTPSTSVILPHEGSSSDTEDDHLYYANNVQSLTATHRHAIRFIRKVKYFVARRKFREALRPYDVTDVIEQYSTGNVDMLARMKYLQARLDKVLGTSKSLDSYESGPSLASRICKIERQVDGLDIKVDQLCQLANNLLDQRSTSIAVATPAAVNHVRPSNRFGGVYRRWQRHRIIRPSIPTTQTSPHSTLTVPSSSITNNSRESLLNLYCLFQDNLNASATDLV